MRAHRDQSWLASEHSDCMRAIIRALVPVLCKQAVIVSQAWGQLKNNLWGAQTAGLEVGAAQNGCSASRVQPTRGAIQGRLGALGSRAGSGQPNAAWPLLHPAPVHVQRQQVRRLQPLHAGGALPRRRARHQQQLAEGLVQAEREPCPGRSRMRGAAGYRWALQLSRLGCSRHTCHAVRRAMRSCRGPARLAVAPPRPHALLSPPSN